MKKTQLLRLIPVAILVIGFGAILAFDLHNYLRLSALQQHHADLVAWRQDNGIVAVLAYIGIYALVTALSIPGAVVLSIAGGLLFGLLVGVIAVVVGATLGAIGVFMAVRFGVGEGITKSAHSSIKKMEAGFRHNAFSYLLLLRLIPIFPFFLVNIVPGLFGIPLSTFALTTFIGIIPGAFAYVSVGNGLGAVFSLDTLPGLEIIVTTEVLLPIISLVALALAQLGYKRWQTKRASQKSQ